MRPFPPQQVPLVTDYEYDKLYRLTRVKTPEGKFIQYWYDGFGRQSQRTTPDAGQTKYSYDLNNNLILSQDANQRALDTRLCTRRTYDALNRLITIGDVKTGQSQGGGNGPMGDTLLPFEFDNPVMPPDSVFIVNVYDTLPTAVVDIFYANKPADFYSKPNFTRGRLTATAFRTYLGEAWSYKFYRYDERGNVIKFWIKLAGMDDMKTMEYRYNSQNQATNLYYQYTKPGWKYYAWYYDDAGRLKDAGLLTFQGSSGIGNLGDGPEAPSEEELDNPSSGWQFKSYAGYTYNADQQVDTFSINANSEKHKYTYNNRNWLTRFNRVEYSAKLFYDLQYNSNGNIRKATYGGSYDDNFSNSNALYLSYTYDNSNRLLKIDNNIEQQGETTFDMVNNYDKEGNFKSMKRYGSQNNLLDNFAYSYYSGTNRVQKVSGSVNQYYYDANGNVVVDSVKQNYYIKYDWPACSRQEKFNCRTKALALCPWRR